MIGGYAGIVTFVIALVTNSYQEFSYEKSLARELYKGKRKGDDTYEEKETDNPKE